MPIMPSERDLRSKFAVSKNNLMPAGPKRSGGIVDSLVFMIVGLLLPVWILGQLFLTCYPAPEGNAATTAGESNVADVGNLDEPEPGRAENNLAHSSMSHDSTSPGTGTESSDEFKVQLDSMKEKFQSLTATSGNLESEVASLKQTNATLTEENATLKTQVTQAAAMPRDVANTADNSAAMNELQSKYDSASSQLETTKQSLFDTTTRLESTENEKRTLQNELTNTTSKLEQANANLAAAVAKSESSMEIKSESSSPFATMESAENSPQPDLAAEANAKVAELEQKLKELTFNLTNTNNAMAAQKEELQSSQSKLQTLMAQNGDLKAALDVAREKATQPVQTELPKEVFRDFVSSQGSVSKMAFIRWEGEAVIVRSFANKKLYRLTMDRFSEADKQYLLDQKK